MFGAGSATLHRVEGNLNFLVRVLGAVSATISRCRQSRATFSNSRTLGTVLPCCMMGFVFASLYDGGCFVAQYGGVCSCLSVRLGGGGGGGGGRALSQDMLGVVFITMYDGGCFCHSV